MRTRPHSSPRPRVSVIIPAYNCALYLVEALHSVLGQTVTGIEIIVVDDGSTDETDEVLASFAGKVQVIRQRNTGGGAAWNAGIRVATGEHVALLDADDVWTPDGRSRPGFGGTVRLMASRVAGCISSSSVPDAPRGRA